MTPVEIYARKGDALSHPSTRALIRNNIPFTIINSGLKTSPIHFEATCIGFNIQWSEYDEDIMRFVIENYPTS